MNVTARKGNPATIAERELVDDRQELEEKDAQALGKGVRGVVGERLSEAGNDKGAHVVGVPLFLKDYGPELVAVDDADDGGDDTDYDPPGIRPVTPFERFLGKGKVPDQAEDAVEEVDADEVDLVVK